MSWRCWRSPQCTETHAGQGGTCAPSRISRARSRRIVRHVLLHVAIREIAPPGGGRGAARANAHAACSTVHPSGRCFATAGNSRRQFVHSFSLCLAGGAMAPLQAQGVPVDPGSVGSFAASIGPLARSSRMRGPTVSRKTSASVAEVRTGSRFPRWTPRAPGGRWWRWHGKHATTNEGSSRAPTLRARARAARRPPAPT
ncbi:hypothetical protein BH11GEM1_BH11GEM1_31770 [soil metagenome]